MTCQKSSPVFFSGDDLVLISAAPFRDFTRPMAFLYNLESKCLTRYYHMYFCSKFLIVVNGRFHFIPDPIKPVYKMGRRDLVNWQHVEEYRQSCIDLTKPFRDATINKVLSDAFNERYAFTVQEPEDISLVLATLSSIALDREAFHALYYLSDGDVLCDDPSLPDLD